MDSKDRFAVSCLLESAGREDFAIQLYARQLHRDPFAAMPLIPQYYVLDEVYHIRPVPVILHDLLGVTEVEIVHREWFLEAAKTLNPTNEPVPRIVFPEDLFDAVQIPEVAPLPGMRSVLRALVTDIVQEQRADLIYRHFARETSGPVSEMFDDVAAQEQAHRRIFEKALADILQGSAIDMRCPVCGKILTLTPKVLESVGCGYCGSRFILDMEADDFVLQLQHIRGDRRIRIPRL
jgi:rubrerythrin